jgi:hypothetical protein
MRYWLLILCCLTGLACNLSLSKQDQAPIATGLPTAAIVPNVPQSPLLPVRDATAVMSGVCFEALQALDGQSFVLENEGALTDLYSRLDSLCPQPVQRTSFDFNQEILVLAFKSAQACTVEVVPQSIAENVLVLHWSQTGNCAYEAVGVYAGALDRTYQGLQVNLSGA